MPHHSMIKIPYNLKLSEVVMEPDRDKMPTLQECLRILADLNDEDRGFDFDQYPEMRADKVVERICRGAIILYKKFPERSFAECLDTAITWEFG